MTIIFASTRGAAASRNERWKGDKEKKEEKATEEERPRDEHSIP